MDVIYTDDEAARAHLEGLLWPNGPVCPRCGVVDEATLMTGKSHRAGLYNCRACDRPFTVTVGTIYERSHIPLHKWVYATHLMTASKKGISAAQLHRMLGFGSYRTAWFMAHRIREAMKDDGASGPLGGEGKIVEADETYHGRVKAERPMPARERQRGKNRDQRAKRPVVALVERGGRARVFHVASADKTTVAKIVRDNVDPASRLHTDESNLYRGADQAFATHETVKHTAGEYARGDVHVNSAEGFFGVFKRGMRGVYQHCDEKYLQRYVTEFEFRHNTRTKLGYNDKERAALATKGAAGKRLTLRRPKGIQAATLSGCGARSIRSPLILGARGFRGLLCFPWLRRRFQHTFQNVVAALFTVVALGLAFMRHLSEEEYVRLFGVTGQLVIHWGLAEESINMTIALVYQLAGGKHVEPELPIMMSRRVRFLRACFNKIALLESFRDEAIELLDNIRPITELRETLCHSCITGITDDGERYVFTSSRPTKQRTIHYLKEAVYSYEALAIAGDAALVLAQDAANLLERLNQALVGEKPDTEVTGGL